jgi:phosphopantetheine--protein transferase-like protein
LNCAVKQVTSLQEPFTALEVSPVGKTGGRVLGIGVDLLRRNSIYAPYLSDGDPFLMKTYSQNEQEAAGMRPDPCAFYETRFCCKEAVFKSLGISGERVRLNEIEILSSENGKPTVRLLGSLKQLASAKGIGEILLSLSYDKDYAEAIAVAL